MLSKKQIIANARGVDTLINPIVYFLIKDGEIVYIGQTRNLAIRLNAHTYEKDFDSFYYIDVQVSELDSVERAYIKAFRPKLNKHTFETFDFADMRPTYKPNREAMRLIKAINKAHPGLSGLSAIINYALKVVAQMSQEKEE